MAHLQVGPATMRLLDEPDYSDWDDEELIHGRRRNKLGRFQGRHPKVVPHTLLQELNRRIVSRGLQKIYGAVLPAIDYLSDVATGKVEGDKERIGVCLRLVDRVFGVSPQRIEVSQSAQTPYEKAGVGRAVILRSAIDVESDEADNPFED